MQLQCHINLKAEKMIYMTAEISSSNHSLAIAANSSSSKDIPKIAPNELNGREIICLSPIEGLKHIHGLIIQQTQTVVSLFSNFLQSFAPEKFDVDKELNEIKKLPTPILKLIGNIIDPVDYLIEIVQQMGFTLNAAVFFSIKTF